MPQFQVRREYVFNVTQTLDIGKPMLVYCRDQPQATLQSKRIRTNVPCKGLITIAAILVGKNNYLINEPTDAYELMATLKDRSYSEEDFPLLRIDHRVTVVGWYTGLVPVGFKHSPSFALVFCFQGPLYEKD